MAPPNDKERKKLYNEMMRLAEKDKINKELPSKAPKTRGFSTGDLHAKVEALAKEIPASYERGKKSDTDYTGRYDKTLARIRKRTEEANKPFDVDRYKETKKRVMAREGAEAEEPGMEKKPEKYELPWKKYLREQKEKQLAEVKKGKELKIDAVSGPKTRDDESPEDERFAKFKEQQDRDVDVAEKKQEKKQDAARKKQVARQKKRDKEAKNSFETALKGITNTVKTAKEIIKGDEKTIKKPKDDGDTLSAENTELEKKLLQRKARAIADGTNEETGKNWLKSELGKLMEGDKITDDNMTQKLFNSAEEKKEKQKYAPAGRKPTSVIPEEKIGETEKEEKLDSLFFELVNEKDEGKKKSILGQMKALQE